MACRREQYFGAWAILPDRLCALDAIARQAFGGGFLAQRAASLPRAKRRKRRQSRAEDDVVVEVAAPAPSPPQSKPYQMLRDGCALLEISGPMTKYDSSFVELFGGTSTVRNRNALAIARADADVRAVVQRFDTPGGTVAGTDDYARDVRLFNKPVVSFFEDCAASAGYYVGAQGLAVVANPAALVGSIGVYSYIVDSSVAADREGYRVYLLSSGEFKGVGVAGVPVSEAQRADIQREVDAQADLFVRAVAEGRRMSIAEVRALATGQVWLGKDALSRGLIDQIGTLDDAVERALKAARAARGRTAPRAGTIREATMQTEAQEHSPTTAEVPAVAPEASATTASTVPPAHADVDAALALASEAEAEAGRQSERAAALERENAALRAQLGARAPDALPDPDPLAGRLAALERENRRLLARETYVTAARGLAGLGGGLAIEESALAELLQSCAESLPQASYQTLLRLLGAKSTAATGVDGLLTVRGDAGDPAVSEVRPALEEAHLRADELQRKEPKLARHDALSQVWAQDPALLERYRAEQSDKKGAR